MSGSAPSAIANKHTFRLRQITALVITSRQLCEKPIFPRAPPNDLFEQRLGLIGPIFPKIGARDIVFRFDLGRLRHLLLVGAWIFDVTEGGELLHQFVSLFTIYLLARYVHPAFTGNFFPARDRLHARRDLERFEQRPAVHIFADRNVEQRQDGRRDIDQARAIDAFVALDARSRHHKYSILPMPDRRACGFPRCAVRALRAGFEAVVGAKDNRRLRTGQLEQALQHHVVKAVRALNDIFVEREILVFDPGQLRRVICHEGVREMIDAIVIDGGEIPRLALHQRGRDRVDGCVIA